MMKQFLLLLYKDFLLRKRCYIGTLCEILFPIIFASIPLLLLEIYNVKPEHLFLNNTFDDYYKASNNNLLKDIQTCPYPLENPYKISDEIVKNQTVFILFTPSNLIALNLTSEAVGKWKYESGFGGNITVKDFENEQQLEKGFVLFSSYPAKVVCFIFHNMGKDLPNSLEYSIRMGDLSNPDMYHVLDLHKLEITIEPYHETLFLGWQAALEQSFINLKSKQSEKEISNFSVSLKRFPDSYQRYPSGVATLLNLWPFFFSFGFMIFASILIYRVTLEKANGMQVLMGTMGLNRFIYWLSSFVNYFVPGIILSFIISVAYMNSLLRRMTIFNHTDFSILFVIILAFIVNLILFSFVLTVLFNHPKHSVAIFLIIYLIIFIVHYFYFYGSFHPVFVSLDQPLKLFLCTVPMCSMIYSLQLLFFLETMGRGIDWQDIFRARNMIHDFETIMYGNIISFFTLIFLLCYLDSVWPFQEGVKQRLFFPFMPSYWFASCFKNEKLVDNDLEMDYDSDLFEDDCDVYPSIFIKNLTVRFDSPWTSTTVIDNLSFRVNPDKITVLLGNGNGRTTLFKVISGLCKPTHGKVFVNGWDVYSNLAKVRKYCGVCLEKCAYYECLTIHEHLQIFAGIKGIPFMEINEQALAPQHLLLLGSVKDELIKDLSEELKKKMNIALAFVGNSEILLLDEPTKCLSSKGSFLFWNMLLSLTEHHTILISSSCVESVSHFGNQFAFLSYGRLLYCGSAEFLKKKLNVGEKLHIKKGSSFKMMKVLKLIQKYSYQVSVAEETESSVIIDLKSDNIAGLFEELELIKKEIGVKSFGINQVAMEDVLLNEMYITYQMGKSICDLRMESSEKINNLGLLEVKRCQNNPWILFYCQLYALCFKIVHCSFRMWNLLIIRILIPFFLISCCFILLQECFAITCSYRPIKPKNLYTGGIAGFIETYSNASKMQSIIQNQLLDVMEENHISVYMHSNATALSKFYAFSDYPSYSHGFVVGGSVLRTSEPHFVAWYNERHHYSAPIALNLIHTAILRFLIQNGTINLKNHPLSYSYVSASENEIYTQRTVIFVFIPLVTAFIGATHSLIHIFERTSKNKLLQLMTGLSVGLYWLITFFWDALFYLIMCSFLSIPMILFQPCYFRHPGAFRAVYILFVFFGWCTIPFSYLVSLAFDKPNYAFLFLFLFYVITGYFTILIYLIGISVPKTVIWILRVFPGFSITEGFYETYIISVDSTLHSNISKEVLDIFCFNTTIQSDSPVFRSCRNICRNYTEQNNNFISFDFENGILKVILVMFLLGLLCFLFLTLIEAAIRQSYKGNFRIKPIHEKHYVRDTDSCVFIEQERIEDLLANGNYEETLMVLDLTKFYGSLSAVNNVTFGVKEGECLAVIGGYNSGKSVLLKMISGEVIPTAGNAFIKDSNLVNNLKKLQANVRYSPQCDTLLNYLTAKEMLQFVFQLYGIMGGNLEETLLQMVKLENHADELIKYYSNINRKKLSVATTIIGCSAVMIFDEPTAGLDLESQKLVWALLNKIKAFSKSAIIFSSKSILECEVLCKIGICNRLALMNDGTLQCIGTFEELAKKYDYGKIVKIILNTDAQGCGVMDLSCVFEVQGFFESNVPRTTLLKYKEGILTYHVGESFLTLSALFQLMDFMKIKFSLHRYLVNESSLYKVCYAYTEETRQN